MEAPKGLNFFDAKFQVTYPLFAGVQICSVTDSRIAR